jgi:hypothetical protein
MVAEPVEALNSIFKRTYLYLPFKAHTMAKKHRGFGSKMEVQSF